MEMEHGVFLARRTAFPPSSFLAITLFRHLWWLLAVCFWIPSSGTGPVIAAVRRSCDHLNRHSFVAFAPRVPRPPCDEDSSP